MIQLIKVESFNYIKKPRPHKLVGALGELTDMVFVFLYFGFKLKILDLITGIFKPPNYRWNWQTVYVSI